MARILAIDAELNSNAAGVEAAAVNTSQMTIVSSSPISGVYSWRGASFGSSGSVRQNFAQTNQTAPFYFRGKLVIAAAPSTTAIIINLCDGGSTMVISLRLTTANKLQIWNETGTPAQVGSDSPALSLNTEYRVELKVDTTTLSATVVEARIDGVPFASGTPSVDRGIQRLLFGNRNGDATLDFKIDDIILNDGNGSFQNTFAGAGKITRLKPNADGDNSDWAGTAGSDYENIDEVTPDDATTILSSNTNSQITDVNIEASGLTAETINVVSVGVRFNGAGGSANATFVVRIKAASGGTVEESSNITPSNTTWVTNGQANVQQPYPLILYDLPGASTVPWTSADLDQAQVGVRLVSSSTNAAQISALWAQVDSTLKSKQLAALGAG